MRVVRTARSLLLLLPLAFAGCANNPIALQNQVSSLQQQQGQLATQNQQLQSRANTLDRDNQELQSLLAQTRQQSKLMEDQVAALREQLTTTTTQLAQIREEKQLTDEKSQALLASQRRRGGASINANNSMRQSLPAVNIPGIEVRQDGDVIRIELPSDRLFDPASARLRPGASTLIDSVSVELQRVFPDQLIGIEGHTDNNPPGTSQWPNPHGLALAQASAVFDYLTSRSRWNSAQLFIIGHGANHPVVSNATPAGKARNRRVELVVYPERRGS